jgi:hypothetical protein
MFSGSLEPRAAFILGLGRMNYASDLVILASLQACFPIHPVPDLMGPLVWQPPGGTECSPKVQ